MKQREETILQREAILLPPFAKLVTSLTEFWYFPFRNKILLYEVLEHLQ